MNRGEKYKNTHTENRLIEGKKCETNKEAEVKSDGDKLDFCW